MRKINRLKPKQIMEIMDMYSAGVSKSEISRKLGVPRSTVIYQIKLRSK